MTTSTAVDCFAGSATQVVMQLSFYAQVGSIAQLLRRLAELAGVPEGCAAAGGRRLQVAAPPATRAVNVTVSGVAENLTCDAMAAAFEGSPDIALGSCSRTVIAAPSATTAVRGMESGAAPKIDAASGSWLILVPVLLSTCIAMCLCLVVMVFCNRRRRTIPLLRADLPIAEAADVPNEEAAPSRPATPPSPTPSPPWPPAIEAPPPPPEGPPPRIGGSVEEVAARPPWVRVFVAKDGSLKVAIPGALRTHLALEPLPLDLPRDVEASLLSISAPLCCHPIPHRVDDGEASGDAADGEDGESVSECSSRGSGSCADEDRTDAEGDGRPAGER